MPTPPALPTFAREYAHRVKRAASLSKGAKALLFALVLFHTDDAGQASAGFAELAHETGASRRSIIRHAQEIEAGGWATRTKGGGRGRPTCYTLAPLQDLPTLTQDPALLADLQAPKARKAPRKGDTSARKGDTSARKGDTAQRKTSPSKPSTSPPKARAAKTPPRRPQADLWSSLEAAARAHELEAAQGWEMLEGSLELEASLEEEGLEGGEDGRKGDTRVTVCASRAPACVPAYNILSISCSCSFVFCGGGTPAPFVDLCPRSLLGAVGLEPENPTPPDASDGRGPAVVAEYTHVAEPIPTHTPCNTRARVPERVTQAPTTHPRDTQAPTHDACTTPALVTPTAHDTPATTPRPALAWTPQTFDPWGFDDDPSDDDNDHSDDDDGLGQNPVSNNPMLSTPNSGAFDNACDDDGEDDALADCDDLQGRGYEGEVFDASPDQDDLEVDDDGHEWQDEDNDCDAGEDACDGCDDEDDEDEFLDERGRRSRGGLSSLEGVLERHLARAEALGLIGDEPTPAPAPSFLEVTRQREAALERWEVEQAAQREAEQAAWLELGEPDDRVGKAWARLFGASFDLAQRKHAMPPILTRVQEDQWRTVLAALCETWGREGGVGSLGRLAQVKLAQVRGHEIPARRWTWAECKHLMAGLGFDEAVAQVERDHIKALEERERGYELAVQREREQARQEAQARHDASPSPSDAAPVLDARALLKEALTLGTPDAELDVPPDVDLEALRAEIAQEELERRKRRQAEKLRRLQEQHPELAAQADPTT